MKDIVKEIKNKLIKYEADLWKAQLPLWIKYKVSYKSKHFTRYKHIWMENSSGRWIINQASVDINDVESVKWKIRYWFVGDMWNEDFGIYIPKTGVKTTKEEWDKVIKMIKIKGIK